LQSESGLFRDCGMIQKILKICGNKKN